jgi:hypothetical protein
VAEQQGPFVLLFAFKHALDLFDQEAIVLAEIQVLFAQRLIHLLVVFCVVWGFLGLVPLNDQALIDEGSFGAGSIAVFVAFLAEEHWDLV